MLDRRQDMCNKRQLDLNELEEVCTAFWNQFHLLMPFENVLEVLFSLCGTLIIQLSKCIDYLSQELQKIKIGLNQEKNELEVKGINTEQATDRAKRNW